MRGGHQLADARDAHHPGALHRCIEHVVRADDCAGVRNRGARPGRMASDFHDDDRLGARCGAQAGKEPARVADALDVQQDVLGLRVVREIVDDLAEIEVARGAERDDAGKADPVRRGPVEHGRAHGARLRNEAERPGQRGAARESGVEPQFGTRDAEAVRADEAHAAPARVVEQRPLEPGALGPGFGEAGGNDHHGAHARLAALVDHFRHGPRRRRYDREVEMRGNLADGGVTGHAAHRRILGIDGEQRPAVAGGEHIGEQHGADLAGSFARPDDRDRTRLEQGRQIVLARHFLHRLGFTRGGGLT